MDNRFLSLLITVALHPLTFLQSAREYQRTWICKESLIYNEKTYNEFDLETLNQNEEYNLTI